MPETFYDRELQSLRDENDSLRAECQELREDLKIYRKQHDDFVNEVGSLLPPSYDADEAIEAIIISFVKDMSEVGRIVAKLTADYR
jgi:predicted  nucleic acid-binding Zn-ribbon protein